MVMRRDTRKQIQKMNTEELDRFLNVVYSDGYKEGYAKACTQIYKKLNPDSLRESFSAVKGIGPKRAEELLSIIEAALHESIEGKK